jgi:hypothetical protein
VACHCTFGRTRVDDVDPPLGEVVAARDERRRGDRRRNPQRHHRSSIHVLSIAVPSRTAPAVWRRREPAEVDERT